MPTKRSRVHPTSDTKHRLTTRTERDPAREIEARLGSNLLQRMPGIARPRSAAIVG